MEKGKKGPSTVSIKLRRGLSHFGVIVLSLLLVFFFVLLLPHETSASQVGKEKTKDEVMKESQDIYELLKDTKPEDLEKLIQAAEARLEAKPKKKKQRKEKENDLGSMLSELLPLAVNALGNEDIINMAANMIGGGDDGEDGNNLTGILNLAQRIFSQPKNGQKASPISSLLQLAALFTPDNQGGENINLGEALQTAANFLSQSGVLGSQKRGEDGKEYSIFVDLLAQYAGLDRELVKQFQDVVFELVSAKDWKSFNEVLKSKTGVSLDETLELLEKSDVKTEVMKTYTPMLVDQIYDFFHPANFHTNLKYLSAISVSKGFDPIDPKRPKKSIAKIIDRIAKEQLNIKVDSIEYLDRIEANVKNMLRLDHHEDIDLQKFDKAFLTERLSEVQREELLDPIIEAFKLYKKSTEHPECTEVLLCFINHPNNVATNVGFKGTMTRLTSSFVAWVLSTNETGRKYSDLYRAILDGDSGASCETLYKRNCPEDVIGNNPFLMRLNYHSEL